MTRVIWHGDAARELPHWSIRAKLANSWHYFAIFYVIVIGIYWFTNALAGRGAILELIITLFLLPLFVGLDQWIQRLLKIATGEIPEVVDLSEDVEDGAVGKPADNETEDIKHFVPLISSAVRVVLVVWYFFAMFKLWGIDLPIGRFFTRTAFSIVAALLLGYIGWQYIKTLIDPRLQGPQNHQKNQQRDSKSRGNGRGDAGKNQISGRS